MRVTAVVMCGAFVGSGLLGVVPASAAPSSQGTEVRVADLSIPTDTRSSLASIGGSSTIQTATVTASSQKLKTFSMVGATLPSASMKSSDVQLRVRTGTRWGAWQALSGEDSGPDTDSTEGRAAAKVNATEPIWVENANAVQARVKAQAATASLVAGKSIRLTMVDPGTLATDSAAGATVASAGQPAIISRAAWGADEKIVCSDRTASSQVSLAVVHHTAGPNSYSSVAGAKRQLRADMAYHVKSRGWCDLGYNFVVDKWGNIYEGRRGSIQSARVGAHASGFNSMSVGISMLGNYSTKTPPWAVRNSVAKLVAWKLSRYGRDPMSSVRYYAGAGSTRFKKGTLVTLPRVIGHRNVGLTSCPGRAGYAQLRSIRRSAASLANNASWVRASYTDQLDRKPNNAAALYWTGVASAYGRRPYLEKLNVVPDNQRRQVRESYQAVLNRNPSAWELNAYLTQMTRHGKSRAQVMVALANGNEFYSQAGRTRTGYAKLLTQRLLGRQVTTIGMTGWTRYMRTHTRAQMASKMYTSPESGRRRADLIVQVLAGRSASAAQKASMGHLAVLRGDERARRSFLLSSSYAAAIKARY